MAEFLLQKVRNFISFIPIRSQNGITVSVCDMDGNALDGYTSYTIFGDSTDRPVEFEKPLVALKGKTVRLKFYMKDAQLYSFIFED